MPIQMLIELDDQGRLNINGPINNKLTAYGMLDLAKDAIREYHEQQAKHVQPATPADVGVLTQGLPRQ